MAKFKPGNRVRFKNTNGMYIEGIVAQDRGDLLGNGQNIIRVVHGENHEEYTELPEDDFILLTKSAPAMQSVKYTCSKCEDTHRMWLESQTRYVPCTFCPVPCQKCGNGKPYCNKTPCICDCHKNDTQIRNSAPPQLNLKVIVKKMGIEKLLEELITCLEDGNNNSKLLKTDIELALFNFIDRKKNSSSG